MISIDLYGHGGTRGLQNVITYWDQARMILQVMDALSIPSAFVLGTSQGGFIATRMALLEPSKVAGLVLCGTSLYSETSLYGSWDIDQVSPTPLTYIRQLTH
jgi:pimeloyl-ACP methyl ester carboxylesterase